MEDTQAIDWDVEEEEETEQSNESLGCLLEPIGRLHIFSGTHGPEKDFPLFLGKNVIGRLPDCSVTLPFASISKQHAVIEISARNKAPVLQDCGSLNGTQILRPPKVLSPGVSHRLRDQELILFADLPCQYHRLDVSPPCVSRGPLTVEETPRVQEGTQPSRLPLAEDSEEEVDFSKECVVKESRTISSPLATVVPESDEEGPYLAPRDSFDFNLDSDTDEEGQHPAARETSSAARKCVVAEAEQPEANGITADICLGKAQPSAENYKDTTVTRDTGNRVVPVGVILERSQPPGDNSDTDVDEDNRLPGKPAEAHLERVQPSGFLDSDTDVEEEGIPATPAVVPIKKRQVFHGVGTRSPGTLGLAHLQESPAGSDTDVEEDEASLAVPLERSQTSMVIDSDTDDEEEVSAALTLARLKESGAVLWNRNADIEKDRAQPALLQEKSLTTSGRESDTDMEEELPVEKRETVLSGHTDKEGTLVIAHSEKGQTPLRDNDVGEEADMSSPGILERSQAASTTRDINVEVKQEVPLEPAVTHQGKHQVPVKGTKQTDKEVKGEPAKLPIMSLEAVQSSDDGETDMEVVMSSEVADVRKSQLLAEGDAGTERATAVLKSKGTLKVGSCGGSPMKHIQQMVVYTGASGEPLQPQREGSPLIGKEKKLHVSEAKDSKDSHDDSEDLDLQATQCFVERENQNLDDALDEPWEVLATQPFCPRESAATEPKLIATHLEANGSCLFPPRATPRDQHPESPVHTEPLGIQGREIQTVEKDMGTPKETERVTPERGPLEREIKEGPPEGERKDVMEEEERTRGIQDREQKQALAGDTQRQESDKKVKSMSPERHRENSKVEMEVSEEIEETEIEKQTLTRETFEKVVEKPVPERVCEATESEVNLERGATEGGTQDQKGQATSPTPEPGVKAGELQGLASAPVVSGSQSGGGRGALVSPKRQQRGHLNCKMLPAETTSMGDPESPDACLPATMPKASAQPLNSFISQSQKHPELQSLLSPLSSSSEPLFPRTRYKRSQETPEPPLSAELEPFHPKPSVRPQRSSRMTPSPLASAALEPHSIAPTAQPATPKSTSRATKGRTHRSSVKTPKLQPFTPTDQPITPTPISRVTRVKTNRSSVKTPEVVVTTASELQPSTSTDQPDTPKLTSRVTRGRTLRSSVNTSEPVFPVAPELQSSASTDQPVIPKPTSRVTRGRTCRSSVKTPEPVFPVTPELQASTPTEQLFTPKPTFVGRTHRSSVNTPEPILPTDPELQPSTSTDQPVTPQPTSRVTRGRTHRTFVKTPEPILLTGPKLQPSTSTDNQPVAPQPTARVTRGKIHRSSVKTPEPIVPIAPELQPSTSTEQPVTPKPTSRATQGRTHRSSVKTPEVVVTTASELESSTSINQPITPKPTSRISRGRTRKSVETPEPVEPSAPDLEPPNSTDQPVTSKAVCQSRALESSTLSAATLPVTPEFHSSVTTDQPVPFEPIPQTSCTRRQRAAGKHGSLTAFIVHKPSPAPTEPKCRSSRNLRPRAQRAAECLGTIPEPSFPQLPEAPIHASQIQKVEAAGTSGFILEPPPKASQSRKRPSTTIDSPPLQKRPQRGEISQKTVFPKEEEEDAKERPVKEEDIVIPGTDKRRDQAEEDPKGIPSRSLRRTKPNQESAAPKVLFTGVVDARGERAVLALGGSLASSVAEASHLVTDRICRTVKFLCALGKGIPILSLDWLHQSRKAGCFLPPDQYVVTDPEQEKNFGFNLRDALHRARERRLLEGYEIHVTPGVQPPPSQMGEIISCCGGTVLSNMPRTYKPQRVVITCPQDFPRCSIPSRVGLPLLSPEFLLTGVLKQEAKPEAFVLSTLEMRST